jgi:methionine-rich copper-binding protein CopC
MKKLLQIASVLALGISVAHAHATLKASAPADGASLTASPQSVTLTFSEPVKVTMLALAKVGGEKQDLKPLPTKADATITVPAPSLSTGQYTVSWRVLSDDGHVMTGQVAFGVGVPAPTRAPFHDDHTGHDEHADHHDHADHH